MRCYKPYPQGCDLKIMIRDHDAAINIIPYRLRAASR
jgi:hypothetical protein